MILSITLTHQPAADLSYLLGKNPARVHEFSVPYGKAHVFYTQVSDTRCTAVLLVDLDPVELVRGRGEGDGVLSQYVNDRPYTASSFLTVAMTKVYRSAMSGLSKERPQLAQTPIELEAHLPVIYCGAGQEMVERCFEPLGYQVSVRPIQQKDMLSEKLEDSGYFAVTISGKVLLSKLLKHLYVLIPAIDGHKHYFIDESEVHKLLDNAKVWLAAHPERDWIMGRYLKRQRSLVRQALEKLLEDSPDILEKDEAMLLDAENSQDQEPEVPDEAKLNTEHGRSTEEDKPVSLNTVRLQTVYQLLVEEGVRSVADLGCGEGKLLRLLLKNRQFQTILGLDVSSVVLEKAVQRLKLDRLPPMQRKRIEIVQGSLTYRDGRLKGFDAACAIEVIEHLDLERLSAFEQTVFAFAQSALVLVTSPNREYNIKYEGMKEGAMRHSDHRFEWNRAEFQNWAHRVGEAYAYTVEFLPIGEVDAEAGPSTQLGVFRK